MRPAPRHVVVAGGGVTGLTAAYRLSLADPLLQVTLVEAATRLGGKITTEQVGGFLLEGGPDALVTFKPQAAALARELGLTDRLVPADPATAGTLLLRDGRLRRMPEGFTGFVPQRLRPMLTTPLLPPSAKLRLALEWAVPPAAVGTEESVAGFVSRRLGPQFYERLVEPLVAGIFGADPAELSVREALPQLVAAEREHRSLTRHVLAERRRQRDAGGAGPAAGGLVAPLGGVGELVDALSSSLAAVDVRTSTTLASLAATPRGYRVTLSGHDGSAEVVHADAVVLAVPAPAAARAGAGLDPGLAATFEEIRHGSTVTVNLGYAVPPGGVAIPGHGYLVPAREGRAARAVTWSSVKFPGRAPGGHLLARVSLGGPGRSVSELDGDRIVALAREELAAAVGLTGAPVLTRVHDWRDAMPTATVGHRATVAEAESRLARHPGVVIAGSAFHGASVPDCIASADRAAQSVLAHLAQRAGVVA